MLDARLTEIVNKSRDIDLSQKMSIVSVMKASQSAINIIILILLVGACAKPPSQFYDSFPERTSVADQKLFLKAIAHQKKGQIEPAIVLWEKFLGKYPNSYEARNNLGFLYYANDQITQAIVQFEQGLKLESGSVKIKDNLLRALKVRVAILEENKEYDEAITNLKRIAQLSSIEEQEKIERQIESFEDKIFGQVKKSNLQDEYQEFLKKYPNSPKNSDEARLWIQKSKQAKERKQKDRSTTPESFPPEGVSDILGSVNEETTETNEGSVILKTKPTPPTTIVPTELIEETTLSPSPKMVEVIKSKIINVHSEPKIESGNIVHKLKAGAQVTYADENEGWYQIEFANGKKGWVIKKYTKLLE